MKTKFLLMVAAFFVLLFSPGQTMAITDHGVASDSIMQKTQSPVADALMARLEEIKTMDMSVLPNSTKRELRREVRAINQDLNKIYGEGLYISVGAAVLIILLLILLL